MGALRWTLNLLLASMGSGQRSQRRSWSPPGVMVSALPGTSYASGGSLASTATAPRPTPLELLQSPGSGSRKRASPSSHKSPPSSTEAEELFLEAFLEGRVRRDQVIEWYRPEVERMRQRARNQQIVVVLAVVASLLTTAAALAWGVTTDTVAGDAKTVSLG